MADHGVETVVTMPAGADGSDRLRQWRANGSPAARTALAPSVAGAVALPRKAAPAAHAAIRRAFAALGGFGLMMLIVYALPAAILAIGFPIALIIRATMFVVRALLGAA